jgi:hypothetical protein
MQVFSTPKFFPIRFRVERCWTGRLWLELRTDNHGVAFCIPVAHISSMRAPKFQFVSW